MSAKSPTIAPAAAGVERKAQLIERELRRFVGRLELGAPPRARAAPPPPPETPRPSGALIWTSCSVSTFCGLSTSPRSCVSATNTKSPDRGPPSPATMLIGTSRGPCRGNAGTVGGPGLGARCNDLALLFQRSAFPRASVLAPSTCGRSKAHARALERSRGCAARFSDGACAPARRWRGERVRVVEFFDVLDSRAGRSATCVSSRTPRRTQSGVEGHMGVLRPDAPRSSGIRRRDVKRARCERLRTYAHAEGRSARRRVGMPHCRLRTRQSAPFAAPHVFRGSMTLWRRRAGTSPGARWVRRRAAGPARRRRPSPGRGGRRQQ